jgi:hypothetical protein
VETGVQGSCNYLEELDSGACPGPDPGFAEMTKMGSFRLFTRSSAVVIENIVSFSGEGVANEIYRD